MLRLSKVNKYYRVGTHSLHVLRDIEVEVADGEFVAIMGASGSGKSTMLNILGILDEYDSGEYWLGDTLIQLSESSPRTQPYRLCFQSFNLLPFKTAKERYRAAAYYQGITRRKCDREQYSSVGLRTSGTRRRRCGRSEAASRSRVDRCPADSRRRANRRADSETSRRSWT
jgi:ABC-type lipoprotein export system ATPase subunit